ncbi:MAG: hypothetical protein P8J32_04700 [bacterium]|nr:hypothetical protein [bacterium]
MKATELASIRLAQNLKKVIKVALLNYNQQSAFYRKCNKPNAHVQRFVQHFYLGFLAEVKLELSQATETAMATSQKEIQSQPSLALQY